MKILEFIQGSDEWRRARAGSLGASAVQDVVARTKSGYAASRANRMAALLVERLTGEPEETYQSAAMLHGIETEPDARAAYSFRTDADVAQVGLVLHPRIEGTHASPDGMIGETGLLEIKCPQPAAHLDVLLTEKIPTKYLTQMQWQMACCERDWCDFVSFSPVFPESMRLFVQRVPRDGARISELETEVATFLTELDEKVARLTERYDPDAALKAAGGHYLMAG